MTNVKQHRNDSAEACCFCLNFRLVPLDGAGNFKCENKNTPDELKTCFNFEQRDSPMDQSFEIISISEENYEEEFHKL